MRSRYHELHAAEVDKMLCRPGEVAALSKR
jgi:hypothetical protein